MQLSDNFKLSEFECNDGSKTPQDVIYNLQLLAVQLQAIRDYTGKAITINSGYRSPSYNQSIGGAKNSQHVKGKAADIVISGMHPHDTYNLLEHLNDKGIIKIGGLGKYDTFTHVDIRDYKARWDNTK